MKPRTNVIHYKKSLVVEYLFIQTDIQPPGIFVFVLAFCYFSVAGGAVAAAFASFTWACAWFWISTMSGYTLVFDGKSPNTFRIALTLSSGRFKVICIIRSFYEVVDGGIFILDGLDLNVNSSSKHEE